MFEAASCSRLTLSIAGLVSLCLAVLAAAEPRAGGVNPDRTERVCGDANADRKLDISDAIRILSFVFQGGAPPVCNDTAPPACESTEYLESWIAQKGIPTLAVTPASVLALTGAPLDLFLHAGVKPDADFSFAHVAFRDGTEGEVPIIFLDSALDLLYFALQEKEEGRGPGKLKILHQFSQCTKVIKCETKCQPLLGILQTHVTETRIGEKDRLGCESAEKGTCEEWFDDVCVKTYYKDDKCEKPTGQTFLRRDPVCE